MYIDGLIENLPEVIEYLDKDSVNEAKEKYEQLGEENQKGVKHSNVTKLIKAINEIERLEKLKEQILQNNKEVQAVILEIESLPPVQSIKIEYKPQVVSAMNNYNSLPDDVKFVVNTTTLKECFDKVEELMAQDVISLINQLPTIDKLDLTYISELELAREKYNEISSRNNHLVKNINKLTELEMKMLELKNVNPIIITIVGKIKELDHVITFKNLDSQKIKVEEIVNLLDTIDKNEYDLISNLDKLEEVEAQIEILERVSDINTSEQVKELIDKLPTVENVTWSNEDAIVDARNAFIKIGEVEQLKVDNITKLEKVEAEFKRIDDGIDRLITLINNIPTINELKLSDEHLVTEALNLYNSSDEKITYYVDMMTKSKLVDAKNRIEELRKNN